MPPKPLPDQPHATALRLACALALGAITSACAVTPLPPAPPPPAAAPAAAPNGPRPAPAPIATPPAPAASPAPATAPVAPAATTTVAPSMLVTNIGNVGEHEATVSLLRYADRVRALTPAELTLEIASLGEPGNQPARLLQLAIALMQANQPVETARALGLAQRAAASTAPDAAPYRPLARLIANRLLEQRKLEEVVERQSQQLREQQRRIDQLNERLEAMRAIERSLNNRAPATAPRPPTP